MSQFIIKVHDTNSEGLDFSVLTVTGHVAVALREAMTTILNNGNLTSVVAPGVEVTRMPDAETGRMGRL